MIDIDTKLKGWGMAHNDRLLEFINGLNFLEVDQDLAGSQHLVLKM